MDNAGHPPDASAYDSLLWPRPAMGGQFGLPAFRGAHSLLYQLRRVFLGDLPGRHREHTQRSVRGGAGAGHDKEAGVLQRHTASGGKAYSASSGKRDDDTGKGYLACPRYRMQGDNNDSAGVHIGKRPHMAAVLLGAVLSVILRSADGDPWPRRKETGLFQGVRLCRCWK